ncbi:MAG: pyrimidine 5'-nucleotidase [Chloroflexota bacterium]
MAFSTFFFDLDDTLYEHSSGLWEAIRRRMERYMIEDMGFSAQEVFGFRQKYFETHGSTLRGLMINHPERVDALEFLKNVHDLPVQEYLTPDPALRQALFSLPGRRIIFTNGDAAHAGRVIAARGLAGCFDEIIDIVALDFVCKPLPEAYRRALELAGERDPRRCIFFDDSIRNLAPAHQIGMYTVQVGNLAPHPAVKAHLACLADLPRAMPELWTPAAQTEENR